MSVRSVCLRRLTQTFRTRSFERDLSLGSIDSKLIVGADDRESISTPLGCLVGCRKPASHAGSDPRFTRWVGVGVGRHWHACWGRVPKAGSRPARAVPGGLSRQLRPQAWPVYWRPEGLGSRNDTPQRTKRDGMNWMGRGSQELRHLMMMTRVESRSGNDLMGLFRPCRVGPDRSL